MADCVEELRSRLAEAELRVEGLTERLRNRDADEKADATPPEPVPEEVVAALQELGGSAQLGELTDRLVRRRGCQQLAGHHAIITTVKTGKIVHLGLGHFRLAAA